MIAGDEPAELGGRWHSGVVLKRDVFSTVERGRFRTDGGEVDAVLRRLDQVPWWSRGLAIQLFRRERRALAIAGRLGIAPPLLFAGRQALVRGWIDGVPLHIAKPYGDAGYFRSAKAALRTLHRAGISHNDLAKEQNWLYGGGRAYLTDFQLASCFRSNSVLFRIAALRGFAASSETQAPLRARSPHRRRTQACSRARALSPGPGWRPARRSITPSRAGSTSPTARAAACASSARRPRSPRV